jgi:hypothetical protein
MRFIALAFLALGIARPTFAGTVPNLAGTWEGSTSCKVEDATGKGSAKDNTNVVSIIQAGPSGPLIVSIDGALYSGTFAPSASDPSQGSGAFIRCGTSDATTNGLLNVIETFRYKIDGNGGGSLKGSGAFVVNGDAVGVCKGSWRRTGPFLGKLVGCAP